VHHCDAAQLTPLALSPLTQAERRILHADRVRALLGLCDALEPAATGGAPSPILIDHQAHDDLSGFLEYEIAPAVTRILEQSQQRLGHT
jgi:hypothetical protein